METNTYTLSVIDANGNFKLEEKFTCSLERMLDKYSKCVFCNSSSIVLLQSFNMDVNFYYNGRPVTPINVTRN